MSLTLTAPTIEVLKNFATINSALLFPKGNKLVTRSVKKFITAEAEIYEEIPRRFCIADLTQFLAVITQFKTPSLNFNESDKYVRLSDVDGGLAVKYHYGDEGLAYAPDPARKLQLPSTEVEVEFTENNIRALSNMARTLGTPEISLVSDGKTLRLMTIDSKNSATNTTDLELGPATSSSVFSFVWKIENLKVIPGTYTVQVSKAGLSKFTNKESSVFYHISLEKNPSNFEE